MKQAMTGYIKKCYLIAFPTDELGWELNERVTFEDLLVALDNAKDVYELLGVEDSIVRERVFGQLSKIMGVDYNFIYNKWLGGK